MNDIFQGGLLVEEGAARLLAKRKIRLRFIDGRVALVFPDSRFRLLVKRIVAAVRGGRKVDAEAVIG